MGITVLSLFDGISCGQIALERAGIKVDRYYASEIKKCAIETTMRNYPGTIQIGDVRKAWYNDGILHTENGDFNVGKIDLLIGGRVQIHTRYGDRQERCEASPPCSKLN